MNPEEIARRAQALVNDQLVQDIFTTLEGRYIHEWRNTPPQDVQKREAAHAAIRALDDFRARLKALANAPKVDAHNNRNAGKR
jgi:hypothetical protein